MLNLLKTNRPLSFVAIFVMQLLMYLNEFIQARPISNSSKMPLYQLVYQNINNPYVGLVISFCLVFLGGLLFDFLLSRFSFFEKGNSFPGFFYVLFHAIHPSFLQLNPVHFAEIFLLLNFWSIMAAFGKDEAIYPGLNSGMLTSIATLFWLPALLFHLFNFFAFVIIKPFRPKEHAAGAVGAIVPFIWAASLLFIINHNTDFIPQLALTQSSAFKGILDAYAGSFVIFAMFFILLNLSLLNVINDYITFKIFSRRIFLIAMILPIFMLVGYLISEEISGPQLLLLGPTIAILPARLFLDLRHAFSAKIIVAVLLLVWAYVQYEQYFSNVFHIKLVP